MKRRDVVFCMLLFALSGFCLGIATGSLAVWHRTEAESAPEPHVDTVSDGFLWDTFREALIRCESNGCETAVGSDDCVGVLQLRPCAVDEANRILGGPVYSYTDRLMRDRSIEIWETVQAFHNPCRSLRRAIELHNPHAPREYLLRVMEEYYFLLKNSNIYY